MILRAGTRATYTLPHTLASARGTHSARLSSCAAPSPHGCAHARLCARNSDLSATPQRPVRHAPTASDRPVRLAVHFWASLGLPTARGSQPLFLIRVLVRAKALRSAAVRLCFRDCALTFLKRRHAHGRQHGEGHGSRDCGRHGPGAEQQRQRQQQQPRCPAGANPWHPRSVAAASGA